MKRYLFIMSILLVTLVMATIVTAQEEVINFICSVGGSGKAFTGGLKLFNEKFKGRYRVEVTMLAIEALQEKYMMQFIAGKPIYDVLAITDSWLPGYVQYLEPLDSLIAKYGPDVGSFGMLIEASKFDDKIVGLPVRFGTRILFYRKDWFAQAGLTPPKTMDEFLDAARKLTKRTPDGRVEVYGTALTAQSPSWSVNSVVQFLFPHGGDLLTKDLKHAHPCLKTEFTFRILNFMKGLWDERLIPNPLAWTYDDAVVAFQQEKLAMSRAYSPRALLIEDPKKSKAADKMGYAVLPYAQIGPEPMKFWGESWNFCIDKNSPRKDAAYQFIKFMALFEAQKHMAIEWANGPTIVSLYDDPDYIKKNPAVKAIREVMTGLGYKPFFPVPQYEELIKVVHEEVHSLFLGRKTAEEVGKSMYDRIEAVLKR